MKYIILFMLLLFALTASTQNITKTADQIRDEIARIKSQTNWESDAEADTANVKIKRLAKELILLGDQQRAQKNGQVNDSANNEEIKKGVEYRTELWDKMQESAAKGENSDIDFAEPVKNEIVEEYKDDQSPKIKNGMYLEVMTVLCIDMSLPTVQRTIDQMSSFKGIQTLVILGGKNASGVDLANLLDRAALYPLKELFILNFQQFVSTIPPQVANFKNLTTLSLVKNNIKTMPACISSLTTLKELYLDANPLTSILPTIQSLRSLEILGVVKTNIPATELVSIKNELPKCQIIVK